MRRGRSQYGLSWMTGVGLDAYIRRLMKERFDRLPKQSCLVSFQSHSQIQSDAAVDEADEHFKPSPKKKDVPEFNARLYRENEERAIQEKIDRLRALRFANNNSAVPTTKQQRKRAKRIPEVA